MLKLGKGRLIIAWIISYNQFEVWVWCGGHLIFCFFFKSLEEQSFWVAAAAGFDTLDENDEDEENTNTDRAYSDYPENIVGMITNYKPDIKSGLNHSITVSKGGNCFWFKQWFQMLNDSLCCWPGRCVQQVDRVQPAAPVTGIRTNLYRYSWLTGFSHQDQSQPIQVQQVGRF